MASKFSSSFKSISYFGFPSSVILFKHNTCFLYTSITFRFPYQRKRRSFMITHDFLNIYFLKHLFFSWSYKHVHSSGCKTKRKTLNKSFLLKFFINVFYIALLYYSLLIYTIHLDDWQITIVLCFRLTRYSP